MSDLFETRNENEESEWLSTADMMAGLMVVFLFTAIAFIKPVEEQNRELTEQTVHLEELSEQLREQKNRIADIALAWREREQAIYQALLDEFRYDLPRWNAEIERETLLVRFNSPEVLFARGEATIRPQFDTILRDFFPRYVRVLDDFRGSLAEVRIEGHTSSDWNHDSTAEQAYFRNMALSQARTRAVLQYVLGLRAVSEDREWLRLNLTANGLSSSRLIMDDIGRESQERSRRVEFRILTDVREEIVRILDAAQ